MMDLLLHTPDGNNVLDQYYKRAFSKATELFIVTAFLTKWDSKLRLNTKCDGFRVIVGKDFGITRKKACRALLNWLPSNRKGQFLVADGIAGFHPKGIFWKESNNKFFMVIGSSNLSHAAFETNYEANVFCPISRTEYKKCKTWVKCIEEQSLSVSEDWLKSYSEAPVPIRSAGGKKTKARQDGIPLFSFDLPRPVNIGEIINYRRAQIVAYQQARKGLLQLFRRCAIGKITSDQFYRSLPTHWGFERGNRLQGRGWERQGEASDFHMLSKCFVNILDSPVDDRDDAVVREIDNLRMAGVPTRAAFLSEMLCLRFPELYPVLNMPIRKYLAEKGFKAPRGASEGARYVDIAKKLRFSLLQNENYPAKNLAELDAIIWNVYGRPGHP